MLHLQSTALWITAQYRKLLGLLRIRYVSLAPTPRPRNDNSPSSRTFPKSHERPAELVRNAVMMLRLCGTTAQHVAFIDEGDTLIYDRPTIATVVEHLQSVVEQLEAVDQFGVAGDPQLSTALELERIHRPLTRSQTDRSRRLPHEQATDAEWRRAFVRTDP